MNTKIIPVLIGDIGGTNSRLSIVKMSFDPSTLPETINEASLPSYKYDSLLSVLKAYLAPFKDTPNFPQLAVVGVPGPVENNTLCFADSFPEINNATGESFKKELGIEDFHFVNDFSANGYGVQTQMIEGVDYVKLNNYKPSANGTIALVGAGTSLGMGFMTKTPNDKYYNVHPSEGCYQDFPHRTERQARYMKYAINHLKLSHLTTNFACCGTTLYVIYLFLYEEEKIKGDSALLEKVLKALENKDEMVKLNKEIITKGINKECDLCRTTIEFFTEIYGQIAGNFAAALLSTGGVYLLGGMSSILEPYIRSNSIFIDNFVTKMTLKPILEKIPITIVKNTNLGVKGALEYARRLLENKQSE